MLVVPHDVYFHHNYRPVLRADLLNARASIKIHDPYLTDRGIEELLREIAPRIGNPLCLCAFVQEPRAWEERDKGTLLAWQQARVNKIVASRNLMFEMQCHVNLRKNIHEKLLTVDDEVAWEGSLNYLSHFDTSERLNRWTGRSKVEEIKMTHKLNDCAQCNEQMANSGLILREGDDSRYAVKSRMLRLGEQIAARREGLGLSQVEVAKAIGTDRKTLSDIERGTRNASVELLSAIGARVGLDLIYVQNEYLPTVANFLTRKTAK